MTGSSVRNKLFQGFGILILFACLLSFAELWSTYLVKQSSDAMRQAVDKIFLFNELSAQAENQLLITHESTLRYKVSTSPATIKRFNTYLELASQNIQKLNSLTENTQIKNHIQNLIPDLQAYVATFTKYVAKIDEKGQENKGIIGDFRRIIHLTEESILKQQTPQLIIDLLTLRRHEKDYLLRGTDNYISKFNAHIVTLINNVTRFNQTELIPLIKDYQEKFSEVVAIDREIKTMRIALDTRLRATIEVLKKNMELSGRRNQQAEKKLEAINYRRTYISIGGLAIQIIFGLLIAWWVARSIVKPLQSVFGALKQSAQRNSSISHALLAASDDMMDASNSQYATIQETSSAMSEMSSRVHRTVDNSIRARDLSVNVRNSTNEGMANMNTMVQSFSGLKQASRDLGELTKIIDEISLETKVINDIVFKTSLLSCNAAIEAARAGQYGKGFAVVASEVGTLAKNSGKAAKEIELLLGNSRDRVQRVVEQMQDSIVTSEKSGKEAKASFDDIANTVSDISSQVESILEAAEEQEKGIQQVELAMDQVDNSAQNTSAEAKHLTSNSKRLNQQSQKLLTLAHSLNILIEGNDHTNPQDHETPDIENEDDYLRLENESERTEDSMEYLAGKIETAAHSVIKNSDHAA